MSSDHNVVIQLLAKAVKDAEERHENYEGAAVLGMKALEDHDFVLFPREAIASMVYWLDQSEPSMLNFINDTTHEQARIDWDEAIAATKKGLLWEGYRG